MLTEIHAVKAVYDAATFNPTVAIQTAQPLYYECYICPFRGTLEQGVEHIVDNQFKVEPPPPPRPMIKKENKKGRR